MTNANRSIVILRLLFFFLRRDTDTQYDLTFPRLHWRRTKGLVWRIWSAPRRAVTLRKTNDPVPFVCLFILFPYICLNFFIRTDFTASMYLVKTSIISRAFRYSLNQSGALKQNHVASEHHLSILYYLTLLHFTLLTLLYYLLHV